MKLTPWEKCSQCEEFWCNLHDQHASACDCPSIEHWLEAGPYDEIELEINLEAITGAQAPSGLLVDMPAFRGEQRPSLVQSFKVQKGMLEDSLWRFMFPKLGDD